MKVKIQKTVDIKSVEDCFFAHHQKVKEISEKIISVPKNLQSLQQVLNFLNF